MKAWEIALAVGVLGLVAVAAGSAMPKPPPHARRAPKTSPTPRAVSGDDPAANIVAAYGVDRKGVRRVDDALAQKIVAVAQAIGANPYDLANVIHGESRFDPQIVGPDGAHYGLLQFSAARLTEMGTTSTALRGMNAVRQMDYVQRYFELPTVRKYVPTPGYTQTQLYMAVFRPADQALPPTSRFAESVVRANPWADGTFVKWKDGRSGRYIATPADYVRFQENSSLLTSDGSTKLPSRTT